MICDKCGCLMLWGVYGISKSSTTYYICRQCGNVHYIKGVTKMRVMIEIDEDLYTRLFDNGDENISDMSEACTAIRKGIPLSAELYDLLKEPKTGALDREQESEK